MAHPADGSGSACVIFQNDDDDDDDDDGGNRWQRFANKVAHMPRKCIDCVSYIQEI